MGCLGGAWARARRARWISRPCFQCQLFQIAAVRRVQRHTGLTHSGALALSPERQSARMSEIKNNGLDQYGKV